MDQVSDWIAYLVDHPLSAGAAAAGLILLLLALNRKPKVQRDAEKDLRQLTKEESGKYDRLRPPH